MKIHIGRKFSFAIFCALVVVFCLAAFIINIDKVQAGLLLTVIAAPSLGIIGLVVGVEGASDIKAKNNSNNNSSG